MHVKKQQLTGNLRDITISDDTRSLNTYYVGYIRIKFINNARNAKLLVSL